MKQDIHICYLINDKFLDLTLNSIKYIKLFFKSKNHKLKFHIIGINDFTVPAGINYIKSNYTYLPILHQRAYIPHMLGVDRVIFIDSDTVTTTCISKLWDVDLNGNIIGAVQHYISETIGSMIDYWSFDFPPYIHYRDKPYFNCGVIVMDCKKWIDNNIAERCLQEFKVYENTIRCGWDEPGFNIVLMNNWKRLDSRWNDYPDKGAKYKKTYITHYYGQVYKGKNDHNMFMIKK